MPWAPTTRSAADEHAGGRPAEHGGGVELALVDVALLGDADADAAGGDALSALEDDRRLPRQAGCEKFRHEQISRGGQGEQFGEGVGLGRGVVVEDPQPLGLAVPDTGGDRLGEAPVGRDVHDRVEDTCGERLGEQRG